MPISQMDDLIQIIDEWAQGHDCSVRLVENNDGKASCEFQDDSDEVTREFTLEYVEVYVNGVALVKVDTKGMTVIMEAIPAAVGAVLYAA